jgi:hypothetical protein
MQQLILDFEKEQIMVKGRVSSSRYMKVALLVKIKQYLLNER